MGAPGWGPGWEIGCGAQGCGAGQGSRGHQGRGRGWGTASDQAEQGAFGSDQQGLSSLWSIPQGAVWPVRGKSGLRKARGALPQAGGAG